MLSLKTFSEELIKILPPNSNLNFLLAVSGGADSMVLLYLFQNLKKNHFNLHFEVAHINYKLRNEDSDLDQKLVENFCKDNRLKLHTYEVSEKDQKPNGSIQLWARDLRYRFFREIQEKQNLEFLVTAHHMNDQLETFLINISRGSGISGISGIPANENNILRPLLNFSKSDIYQFALEQKIPYREDISNKKNDYIRNKIRNEISPKLTEINSHFLENFRKSLNIINQSKDFINVQIHKILNDLTVKKEPNLWILDKIKLGQESGFVKFEILKKFGFQNMTEISKIFSTETGKTLHSDRWKILIDRNIIILTSSLIPHKNTENKEEFFITEQEIHIYSTFFEKQELNWKINTQNISFPLKIKHPKKNDVFYPSGMIGKKKISKFLKDEKIPILERKNIWILCDSDEKILGVLPLRQDRRFISKNDDFTLNIMINC